MADLSRIKDGARAMWSRGDYPRIAERIEGAAREVVDGCAISAGQEVLDIAAGNGNAAVLAAREGAAVVASDFAPAMVELGRARTESEGLDVEWTEADAEDLPFEDERFDCATSVFGAMFAPRPDVVARELFRVVRPGNTVGMANWTPDGFNGRFFALARRYAPPPPEDLPDPLDWGREEVVRERFADLAGSVLVEPRVVGWSFADSEEAYSFFSEVGPSASLMEMLDDEGRSRFHDEFVALVDHFNTASDGSVEIDAEYLLVVARRRG